MPKKKKPAPKSAARRPVKPAPKAKALAKSAVKKPAPVTSAAPVVPSVTAFREAILRHLKSTFARDPITASRNDWWSATCMAARDLMLERYIATQSVHSSKNVRRVYYFSLEYLMGRVLSNNLVNLGLREVAAAALKGLGQDLEAVTEEEADMGLGNGGLGRLAACFMESLASLEIPATGYGIRYEFGIFRQQITPHGQVESTDPWLAHGNPWEVIRPEWSYPVQIGEHTVLGVAYDTPIIGCGVRTACAAARAPTLRAGTSRCTRRGRTSPRW